MYIEDLTCLKNWGKEDKMRGQAWHFISFFPNSFNKFNKTRVRMLHSIYHDIKIFEISFFPLKCYNFVIMYVTL